MTQNKIIYISKEMDTKINGYLHARKHKEFQGDNTIVYTMVFSNNIEMDIKCCGCKDESSWTEAVLFNNGHELCCSEVYDTFIREWRLDYNDNIYIVNIEIMINNFVEERL